MFHFFLLTSKMISSYHSGHQKDCSNFDSQQIS